MFLVFVWFERANYRYFYLRLFFYFIFLSMGCLVFCFNDVSFVIFMIILNNASD